MSPGTSLSNQPADTYAAGKVEIGLWTKESQGAVGHC